MLHLKKGQIQFRSFYDLGVGLRLTFLRPLRKEASMKLQDTLSCALQITN